MVSSTKNPLGQPIGAPVPDWTPRLPPPRTPMQGRFCRVELLDVELHAAELFEANALDTTGAGWTYLPYGPFDSLTDYSHWLSEMVSKDDPLFHCIIDLATSRAVGVATLMRIDPANGVIETGHIRYSPLLQRKPAATEAMYLLMRRVFDELGYRRYEWKCNALNEPSRSAGERIGFVFEGVFRQAAINKGRNRNTAWYSIIDSEWPKLKQAFEAWLDPSNFDAAGEQKQRLGYFMLKGA